MTLDIIKHENCHIHITMGKMGNSLNSNNKAFLFRDDQSGVKRLNVKYPSKVYIALEPTTD
jgi:hypothetical protein